MAARFTDPVEQEFLEQFNKAIFAADEGDLRTLIKIFKAANPQLKYKLLTTPIPQYENGTLLISVLLSERELKSVGHTYDINIIKFIIAQIKSLNDNTIFDIRCKNGATALIAAIEFKLENIVRLLIENDVNIKTSRNDNTTTLMLATQAELSPKILSLFCTKELLDLQNAEGRTALHFVKNIQSLNTILKARPKLDVPDKLGLTPLHTVLRKITELGPTTVLKLVKALVEAKCDITACDRLGHTPLMQIDTDAGLPIFEFLVSVGANLNARSVDNASVLTLSIHSRLKAITSFMLDQDKTIVDSRETQKKINKEAVHKQYLSLLPRSHQHLSLEAAHNYLIKSNYEVILSTKDDPRFYTVDEMSPLKMALIHKNKDVVLMIIMAFERRNLLKNLTQLVLDQKLITHAVALGNLTILQKLMKLIENTPHYTEQASINIILAANCSSMKNESQEKTEFLEIIQWQLKMLYINEPIVTQSMFNTRNKIKSNALRFALSMGSPEVVECLLQEGAFMTNMSIFLYYVRLSLRTTGINTESGDSETLEFYRHQLKTAFEHCKITNDNLETCLEILPMILDLQISSLLNQEFGLRKTHNAVNALINFLTESHRSLVPNLEGYLIISLTFHRKIVPLTIDKKNVQIILKKIDELIIQKTGKALSRSITHFLLSLTNEFIKEKDVAECRRLLEEHESLVIVAKNRADSIASYFEGFSKEIMLLKKKIKESYQKCMQELSFTHGNWCNSYKENCDKTVSEINLIEQMLQKYYNELNTLKNNEPLKTLNEQYTLLNTCLKEAQPAAMQIEIQKFNNQIKEYERTWSLLKKNFDDIKDSLTKVSVKFDVQSLEIQSILQKEREVLSKQSNEFNTAATKPQNNPSKNKSKKHKKGASRVNIENANSKSNKPASAGAGAGAGASIDPHISQQSEASKNTLTTLQFPSDTLLLATVVTFKNKVRENQALTLQYQQRLIEEQQQDNKILVDFTEQQLLASVRTIKTASFRGNRAKPGLSPSEFTLDMAGGISIYTRFHDECLVLESVLRELEQWDNNDKAPTLTQIITKRNALLGISSRAMEIIKKLKIEYSPINPELAEHYRDVMAHADADKDLSLILELKSTIEDQQKHYQEIKTMVSLMLAYIRAYNNNSKDEAELCTQLYSNAQFQKIMRYKINNKPTLAVCESMIALHQEELDSLERKEISDTILSHALGFIEGRMGAFSAGIRDLYPDVFKTRAELQKLIKPGIDYRHVVDLMFPHSRITRHFPEANSNAAGNAGRERDLSAGCIAADLNHTRSFVEASPVVFNFELTKKKTVSAGPGDFVVAATLDETADESVDETAEENETGGIVRTHSFNNETLHRAVMINGMGAGTGAKASV